MTAVNRLGRLDDHAFATAAGEVFPPLCARLAAGGVSELDGDGPGGPEGAGVGGDETAEDVEVPGAAGESVDGGLDGERGGSGGADGGVLPAEQLAGFCGPRQQLAVDDDPVRSQFVPDTGCTEPAADLGEEIPSSPGAVRQGGRCG